MRRILAGCALIVLAAGVTVAEDMYTTKYDKLNVTQILLNEALFNNYYNCLNDRGKCTPDGEELKGVLVEALGSKCAKCSEVQKKKALEVIRYLINNKQEVWKELADKYDPEGKYRKAYEEEAKERGLVI